jgi:hypothetical protein
MASSHFMFGNPTMAYIDMAAFLEANNTILALKYYTINNSTWSAQNLYSIEANNGTGLLAPMRSVMLELKEGISDLRSIKLKLSHEHLRLNATMPATDDQPANIQARNTIASTHKPQGMTIYATTATGQTQCMLFAAPEATDTYLSHEDVLFISTGVETANILTTPINMYTVSSQVPMMIDVRQNIDTVPLSMLVHNDYRTEMVEFAFYLTMNWNKECYFCDAVTGDRIRIMDGTIVKCPLPLNHEQRYYIEGPDTYQGSDGVVTSTTQPSVSNTGNKVWAYAPDRSNVVISSTDLIKSATLYDITGRLITQSPNTLITNSITLSTTGTAGVYIVDVTLRDGSTEQAQVIIQ